MVVVVDSDQVEIREEASECVFVLSVLNSVFCSNNTVSSDTQNKRATSPVLVQPQHTRAPLWVGEGMGPLLWALTCLLGGVRECQVWGTWEVLITVALPPLAQGSDVLPSLV